MNPTTLIDIVIRSQDVDVRLNAIEQLGHLKQSKAVGPLVQHLKDASEREQVYLCEALGRIADSRAVAPLVSMLKVESEEVRGEAFSALLQIGYHRAQFMPPDAQGDSSSDPRMALTQIAWPADMDAIQILLTSISDPDPEIRIGCAYTLGRLGIGAALEKLVFLLENDADSDVRAAAAFAMGDLGESGDSRVKSYLVKAWGQNQDHLECCVAIIRALSTVQGHELTDLFSEAAGHADERIRQLAAMALGQTPTDAATRLFRMLNDPSHNVKRIAIGVLGRSKHPNTIQALVNSTVGMPAEIRFAVASALMLQPTALVHDVLRRNLSTSDVDKRAAATFLIGRLGPHDLLSKALEDADPQVRKAAALALGTSADPQFSKILKEALTDDVWFVRVAAAEGLRRLGSADALSELRTALSDEHPVVRNAAKTAIEGLS
ncbi:MAG: HEAT repeat domain-containing protein [Myxococcota bacterium]|nr:HEAT repeat domain-containing protein [Myxococcota bacterium]